jgi:hypothetical protein
MDANGMSFVAAIAVSLHPMAQPTKSHVRNCSKIVNGSRTLKPALRAASFAAAFIAFYRRYLAGVTPNR